MIANEREFLESLFGRDEETRRIVGSVRVFSDPKATKSAAVSEKEQDEESIRELLDKNLESCARPLKVGYLPHSVRA